LIYGTGTGPDKIISALTPSMISTALKQKQVVVAGRGTNLWPDVSQRLIALADDRFTCKMSPT
jgi:hypothetical protein